MSQPPNGGQFLLSLLKGGASQQQQQHQQHPQSIGPGASLLAGQEQQHQPSPGATLLAHHQSGGVDSSGRQPGLPKSVPGTRHVQPHAGASTGSHVPPRSTQVPMPHFASMPQQQPQQQQQPMPSTQSTADATAALKAMLGLSLGGGSGIAIGGAPVASKAAHVPQQQQQQQQVPGAVSIPAPSTRAPPAVSQAQPPPPQPGQGVIQVPQGTSTGRRPVPVPISSSSSSAQDVRKQPVPTSNGAGAKKDKRQTPAARVMEREPEPEPEPEPPQPSQAEILEELLTTGRKTKKGTVIPLFSQTIDYHQTIAAQRESKAKKTPAPLVAGPPPVAYRDKPNYKEMAPPTSSRRKGGSKGNGSHGNTKSHNTAPPPPIATVTEEEQAENEAAQLRLHARQQERDPNMYFPVAQPRAPDGSLGFGCVRDRAVERAKALRNVKRSERPPSTVAAQPQPLPQSQPPQQEEAVAAAAAADAGASVSIPKQDRPLSSSAPPGQVDFARPANGMTKSALIEESYDQVELPSVVDMETPVNINNPGYRIMIKQGWDPSKGLGRDLQGRISPIQYRPRDGMRGLNEFDINPKYEKVQVGEEGVIAPRCGTGGGAWDDDDDDDYTGITAPLNFHHEELDWDDDDDNDVAAAKKGLQDSSTAPVATAVPCVTVEAGTQTEASEEDEPKDTEVTAAAAEVVAEVVAEVDPACIDMARVRAELQGIEDDLACVINEALMTKDPSPEQQQKVYTLKCALASALQQYHQS